MAFILEQSKKDKYAAKIDQIYSNYDKDLVKLLKLML